MLELRRKDNGKPVWVQWWSRPAAGGNYTRTMFLDITDRVLMEQEQARLEAQNDYLWEEIRSEHNFGDIIGESPGLRKVMQQIQLVAPTDAAVLDHRRKRHGQGTRRPCHPRPQPAKGPRPHQA